MEKIKYNDKYYYIDDDEKYWIDIFDEETINRDCHDSDGQEYEITWYLKDSYLIALKILRSLNYNFKTKSWDASLITLSIENVVRNWFERFEPERKLPQGAHDFYVDEYISLIIDRDDMKMALNGEIEYAKETEIYEIYKK